VQNSLLHFSPEDSISIPTFSELVPDRIFNDKEDLLGS
jgi:hypothetical protein